MNILTKITKDKGNTPKDIIMIKKLIESEGIEEYEKNCLNYISEFLNTYITEVLEESQIYAKVAQRQKPTIDDVKLAVKLKKENFLSSKPDHTILKSISNEINKRALPAIPTHSNSGPSLLLPSAENCQLKNNFQIYSEEVKNTLLKRKSKLKNNICNKVEEKTQHKKTISLSHKKGSINKSEGSEGKHDTVSQKDNSNLNEDKEDDQYDENSNHYNDEKKNLLDFGLQDEENYDF